MMPKTDAGANQRACSLGSALNTRSFYLPLEGCDDPRTIGDIDRHDGMLCHELVEHADHVRDRDGLVGADRFEHFRRKQTAGRPPAGPLSGQVRAACHI